MKLFFIIFVFIEPNNYVILLPIHLTVKNVKFKIYFQVQTFKPDFKRKFIFKKLKALPTSNDARPKSFVAKTTKTEKKETKKHREDRKIETQTRNKDRNADKKIKENR